MEDDPLKPLPENDDHRLSMLEAKVDKLLKYQTRLHHMAIMRAIFSFLTFFIIVVLPIIGFFYLADLFSNAVGLSLEEIGETLKHVRSLTDFSAMDDLKNLLN